MGLAYRIVLKHIPLKDAILNDTYKFVHSDTNLLDVTWRHYFAEPFLFHYTDQVVLTQNAEVLPYYPFVIYDLIILFILVFALLWGGLFKYKTTICKICASFFLYNIIIHFVCGYGNNELQLFCGHWIFFIPILVAIGNLVDPPATMINASGDYVVSYIVSRFVDGKDWLQKKLNQN